jgi:putative nucleotidyltransferase with HDIG domain
MGKKGLIGSRKLMKSEETFGSAVEQSKSFGIFILALVWIACVTVLVLPNPQTGVRMVEKQEADRSIFSNFDFTYEDKDQTRESQEKVKSEVPLYFRIDQASTKNSLNDLSEFFSRLQKKVEAEKAGQPYVPSPPENKTVDTLLATLDKVTINNLDQIARDPEQRDKFIEQIKLELEQGIINRQEKETHTLGQMIRIIDSKGRIKKPRPLVNVLTPNNAAKEIADSILKYYSFANKDNFKQSLVEIISSIIGSGGNLVYDKSVTEENQNLAADQVKQVMLEVRKGQPIITKGQTVTKKDLDLMRIYFEETNARMASTNFWKDLINSALITLFIMIMTGVYLLHIHPEVTRSNQKMWLIGTAVIFCIFINYFFVQFFNILSPELNMPPGLITEIIPLAVPAILLSVLIGLRVAVYIGIFVSIIAALMIESSFSLMLEGLLISGLAGFAVRRSPNYRSFFVRSLFIVPVLFLILDLTSLWDLRDAPDLILWTAGLAFANGILTAIIALILLFLFESVFQVSTNMTLLMLCDYNHPLLKRLQFDAPGTYHHSIMVSTLAEHAAQAIGANPIKARVGALFHDIGKLAKPDYFIENNIAEESKHKELHPRMSSLIILNHVKEGVDMALKFKLRKIIRDAIEQHHGTDLVYYFYKRALEENREKNTPVEEQEYRYPGPLPREKEVVLISLADACEAASRTLQKASHGKIDALVWEIFRKRLRDGQLDRAELTFGELSRVRASFVKTLTTMLHGRVPYPKDEDEEKDENDLFMASKKQAVPEKDGSDKDAQKGS